MGKVTPFGVSIVEGGGNLPDSDTGLRLGHKWRELIAQQPEFSAELCSMMLDAHKVFKAAAIRTLRRTVLGEEAAMQLLPPEEDYSRDRLAMPTSAEVAQYGGRIPVIVPTDEEKRRYAGVGALTDAGKEDIAQYANDKGTLVLQKLALDKDAIEAVEGNLSDIHELVKTFVNTVDGDQLKACEALEETMALIGRCLVLMKRSSPVTDNVELAQDYRKQSRDIMMESVQEMLGMAIQSKLASLPDDPSRQAFVAKAQGIFDLFFTPQHGYSH